MDSTGLGTQKDMYTQRFELYINSIFERFEENFTLLDHIMEEVKNILIAMIMDQSRATYLSGIRFVKRYTGKENIIMHQLDYHMRIQCDTREVRELETYMRDLYTALHRIVEKYNDTAYFDLTEVSRIHRSYIRRIHTLIRNEIHTTFVKSSRTQFSKLGYMNKKFIASDKACNDCRALDGMIVGINETFDGKSIPIHPECECMEVGV